MGVPTSEVGYTSAMPRREDREVHKGHVGHWIKKKKKQQEKTKKKRGEMEKKKKKSIRINKEQGGFLTDTCVDHVFFDYQNLSRTVNHAAVKIRRPVRWGGRKRGHNRILHSATKISCSALRSRTVFLDPATGNVFLQILLFLKQGCVS